MSTKTVKIIVKGRYNDESGRAKNLVRDDLLTTHEWYADSLIESKLARKYAPKKKVEKLPDEDKVIDEGKVDSGKKDSPKSSSKDESLSIRDKILGKGKKKKKSSKKNESKSNPFLDPQ